MSLTTVAFFLISTLWVTQAWSGEVKCDNFPANSLSRIECERSASQPKHEQRTLELGVTPGNPALMKYQISATIDGDQFYANPFQFQNQPVVIRNVRFQRMLEKGDGIFETRRRNQILISGLPDDLFSRAGQSRDMIILPMGTTPMKSALGHTLTVPHALFLEGG